MRYPTLFSFNCFKRFLLDSLKSKDLDAPDLFCIILVPCTLVSMEIHNIADFGTLFQNSKMIQWWPPNLKKEKECKFWQFCLKNTFKL